VAKGEAKDADARLTILLVLKVKYDGAGQNQAAKELHCLSSWPSKWIGRFEEEGIGGLRTREKSGRPPKITRSAFVWIKRKVDRNESGLTTSSTSCFPEINQRIEANTRRILQHAKVSSRHEEILTHNEMLLKLCPAMLGYQNITNTIVS